MKDKPRMKSGSTLKHLVNPFRASESKARKRSKKGYYWEVTLVVQKKEVLPRLMFPPPGVPKKCVFFSFDPVSLEAELWVPVE